MSVYKHSLLFQVTRTNPAGDNLPGILFAVYEIFEYTDIYIIHNNISKRLCIMTIESKRKICYTVFVNGTTHLHRMEEIMEYERFERMVNNARIRGRRFAGSFRSIMWERQVKTKKAYSGEFIVKRTSAYDVRMGVNYDKIRKVQMARLSGDKPAENAGLIGRFWVIPNLVLQSIKTDKKFLRVTTCANSRFVTEYFLNGRKVNKEDIEYMLLSSEKNSGHTSEVFDIPIENILYIS